MSGAVVAAIRSFTPEMGMITIVPSSVLICCVTPNLVITIRVAAVVVEANSLVGISSCSSRMLVRGLAGPLLARLPMARDVRAPSVARSITFVCLIADVVSWSTMLPTCHPIISVAPNVGVTIRIAAEIMIAKTFVGIIGRSTRMFRWRLCSPFLALLASDCVILTTAVTVLFLTQKTLIANFQILIAPDRKLHSPAAVGVETPGTHLTIACCDLEPVRSGMPVWVRTDSLITSI